MKEALTELCFSHPHMYRLCHKVKCIPYQEKCPCKADSEFQCSLGNCIPIRFRCDGIQHCMYGEDEKLCHLENTTEVNAEIQKVVVTESYIPEPPTSESELSLPVLVTVVSFSVFILILLFILLCFYITSRRTDNASKESQSATQPLQESYLASHAEDSDSSDQSREIPQLRIYKSTVSSRSNCFPMNVNNCNSDYQVNIHEASDDNFSMDSSANNENASFKGRNMAINPDVEIYNSCAHNESRADGLGKFTFKPTFNYMKRKSYHETNEEDSDKLLVRSSYKKCSSKTNTPSNMSIDKGEEKISFKFASDLLCSSTPRQSHKHSVSCSNVSYV